MGSSVRCLIYSLLILPPLLAAATYHLLASFPEPRPWLPTSNSLASLPKSVRSWTVYPEDFYPGGSYVNLPAGRTRYWLFGPETGKKVVLIHGLSVPSIIRKRIAPELATRGMRVLVYDLYGRGYSDAPGPPAQYDTALYTVQLALLMQHIQWNTGADVVIGLSMGGAVASAFVGQFPALSGRHVVLLSSAGVMNLDHLSRTTKFMSAPLIQDILSVTTIRRILQYISDSKVPVPNQATTDEDEDEGATQADVDDVTEIVRLQSAHLPLFNAALASSIRDGPIRGLESVFSSDSWDDKDVMIIHGTKDNIVPYGHTTTFILTALQSRPRKGSVQLVTMEGGNHDLTLSRPKEVLDAVIPFLGL